VTARPAHVKAHFFSLRFRDGLYNLHGVLGIHGGQLGQNFNSFFLYPAFMSARFSRTPCNHSLWHKRCGFPAALLPGSLPARLNHVSGPGARPLKCGVNEPDDLHEVSFFYHYFESCTPGRAGGLACEPLKAAINAAPKGAYRGNFICSNRCSRFSWLVMY
jgi:hypothetical protein